MIRLSNISNHLFGGISCLFALAIAATTFFAASQLGNREIRRTATVDAETVVAITSGFVRTYSELQSKLEEGLLPNPAAFRAMALHRVDQSILQRGGSTSVIGLPGREIANAATDENMKTQIRELELDPDIAVLESVFSSSTQTTHRTMVPFFALEPACADCHNRLQNLAGDDQWKVGDLMGVQYVDQSIDLQLAKLTRTVWTMSTLVFLTVIACSYCFLFLFRQFQLRRELQKLATTDSMTGCINRREMYSRIKNLGGPVSGVLLMLDLDRFKHINDTHGHAAGDTVIRDFSSRIQRVLRSSDWVARIGGEEFVVWMSNAKPESALLVAERLRKEIESSPVQFNNKDIDYTVSIGVYFVDNAEPSGFDSWLKAADDNLYRAKNDGRNKVEFQLGANPVS